jgi:hypothetical protein
MEQKKENERKDSKGSNKSSNSEIFYINRQDDEDNEFFKLINSIDDKNYEKDKTKISRKSSSDNKSLSGNNSNDNNDNIISIKANKYMEGKFKIYINLIYI